jgi:hypothetical protein
MRHVFGLVILAVALAITGCSLFRDPRVSVAEVVFITAPDTVRVGSTFSFAICARLGCHSEFVLDHVDTSRTSSRFELRVWSRDVSRKGYAVLWVVTDVELTYQACPAEPGIFRIVAYQPDRRITEKIITVLP